jgi:hypothetical protein
MNTPSIAPFAPVLWSALPAVSWPLPSIEPKAAPSPAPSAPSATDDSSGKSYRSATGSNGATAGNGFPSAPSSSANAIFAQLIGQDSSGDGARQLASASAAYQVGAALAGPTGGADSNLEILGYPAPLSSGHLLDLVV